MAVDTRQRYASYVCDARFFRDRPDLVTQIRWYTVPADRAFLPFSHSFMSRRWERNQPQLPIGEVQDSFAHARDVPVPGAFGLGYCGTVRQWQEGAAFSLPPPLNPDNGLPACCPATYVGRGGLALGGPVPPRVCCPHGLPGLIYLRFLSRLNLSGVPPWPFLSLPFLWGGSSYKCLTNYSIAGLGNTQDWRISILPTCEVTITGPNLFQFDVVDVLHCAPFVTSRATLVYVPGFFDYIWSIEIAANACTSIAAGGSALGAYGIRHAGPFSVGRGGQGIGGEGARPVLELGQGGQGIGGEGRVTPIIRRPGGQGIGGEGIVTITRRGRGGQGTGGQSRHFFFSVGRGGQAQEGNGSPL